MNIFKIVTNIATHIGHDGIVRLLVENGADVNAVNVNFDTALTSATREGKLKHVKSLFKTGH